jgi:hypothetical protein
MIPSRSTPIEVNAAPRSVTVIDIGVIESASITGTVAVWGYREGGVFGAGAGNGAAAAEPVNLGGLGNVVLELRNGADPVRRLSNAAGRFEFPEVRPGHYTLSVIGGLIPTYHHVEQETYKVELAPGQQAAVEVRVLQERRRIQMVDAGTLVVEEGGPEKPPAPGTTAGPTDTTAPVPVEQPPVPVEQPPVEPQPEPVQPPPVQPPSTSGETHVAPDQPPHGTLVMAAQAGFNAPAMTWQQILAVMQTQPIPPSGPPAAAATAPATAAPPAVAPKPPSTTPATTAPATTAPAAPAPAAVPPVPAPTPPPIRIPIPLPMPTPKPPVTVPVPTPTPQPFWP